MCNSTKVNKQKIINYTFKDNISELNFFVNKTNFHAFNSLVNQESTFSFLYGPKNQVNHFLLIFGKINIMQINLQIILKI